MSLEEIIVRRRSVRKYSSSPVDTQELRRLLDTARWAPNACNKQECWFIIVDDKKLLEEIVAEGASKILLKADKVLFVLCSALTDNVGYADNIQSASAIVQNFLLLAHENGIGTCWICHLPRKKTLARILNIPTGVEVLAAVSLGYADLGTLRPVERKARIGDLVGMNRFYSGSPIVIPRKKIVMKRFANRVYYCLPRRVKAFLDGLVEKRFVKKFEN